MVVWGLLGDCPGIVRGWEGGRGGDGWVVGGAAARSQWALPLGAPICALLMGAPNGRSRWTLIMGAPSGPLIHPQETPEHQESS